MSLSPWAQLEQDCLDLLATHKAPDGPWMTLDVYSVERNRLMNDGSAGLLPAAFVCVSSTDYEPANVARTVLKEIATLSVVIMWRHPGSDKDLRHGTDYDAGLYALASSVIDTLADETPTAHGWSALLPLRTRQTRISPSATVVRVEFQCNRRISRDEMKDTASTAVDLTAIYGAMHVNDSEEANPELLVTF